MKATAFLLLALAVTAATAETFEEADTSAFKRTCNPQTATGGQDRGNIVTTFDFSCAGGGAKEKFEVTSVTVYDKGLTGVDKKDIVECANAKDILTELCGGKEKCTVKASDFAACGKIESFEAVMVCKDGGIDIFTILILLIVFFVILAMGTTCVRADFEEVWKSKKRAFLCGWASQFGFMPLFAYIMAVAFDFPNLVAVGVVLCGAAPGGTTSNLFTYWSGGNVALSIAMSLASTICAVFMLPLLIEIYIMTTFAESADGQAELDVRIPFKDIAIIAFGTILLPVTLGILIRKYNTEYKCGGKFIYKWVEIVGSVFGGLFLLAAVVVGIRDNPDLMKPSAFPNEWFLGALFEPVGCGFGYAAATLAGLDARDRTAVALETGVQNYTLVISIAVLTYTGCTRVEALTFVLIASLWYIFSSTWVVLLLRHLAIKAGAVTGEPPAIEGAKTGDDGWAVDMRYGWSKQEPEYVAQSGESKGSDGGGGGDGRDGVEMTKV